MVHDYNEANAGTSHIEGIHYDVEYHGYKYDGVNTCPDGNSEEALTCPARQYFVNFVKRGYAKAQELGLKTQYDVTVYGTNYSFYYNENHEVVNLLDEIIDYCDDLIIMAYGNSPKNTLPSFIYKGDYTYQGVTMYMDKTYYEKMHERNKNIYVGQEIEVFRNTAQELVDYPELGPIYLPEYEGENGTTYVYTYDFVMNLFNDLEDKFKDNGIDDIRIVVHDYSQLVDLLAGKEVSLPTFNFNTGSKEYRGNTLKLKDDEILVIEGIHCMNDRLTSLIPKDNKFKIYISDLTVLNIDFYNRISTTDTRLIRRIVRDHQFRGYSALETLQRWYSVNRGEQKYIFPFQEDADCMFNSSIVYELAVLKQYALPLLEEIPDTCPEYMEARRLIALLKYFEDMDSNLVPNNSLLREFIGGSIFED